MVGSTKQIGKKAGTPLMCESPAGWAQLDLGDLTVCTKKWRAILPSLLSRFSH